MIDYGNNKFDSRIVQPGSGLYTKMSDEQKNFLQGIRDLYIEARYREVKDTVARRLNSENTAAILEQTKHLHLWILEKIKEMSSTR